MNSIFEEENTDAILLVDASNAFNSINRKAFLHNIQSLCPALSTYVRNCYSRKSRLFVDGGMEIKSEEVKSVAFADDLAGAGKLRDLLLWWNTIVRLGPLFGYHPKASKSWLIVKDEERLTEAMQIFSGTDVKITCSGKKYLGGTIGDDAFKSNYIKDLISKWIEQIKTLSDIAKSQPQCAYSAFVGGFVHKFTYHLRVLSDIQEYLTPLDHAIDNFLIPALTEGHHCSFVERRLLALPVRYGGLGIPILSEIAEHESENSRKVSKELTENIIAQRKEFRGNDNKGKYTIMKEKEVRHKNSLSEIRNELSTEEKKANDLAQVKGASNWLTAKPLKSEHFDLTKREFFDSIAIRYRWQLKHLPSICACGKRFSIEHALSCPKGGFIYQRHNEIRDTLAMTLNEVTKDVTIEPQLEPITGEHLDRGVIKEDGARADISARGFWTRGQRAFFDVRVFNAYAQRYSRMSPTCAFEVNEKEKKRHYNQRIIQVDGGSFTPLIFSTNGGAGREAQIFIKALATLLSEKRDELMQITLNYLRTKISFALARSTVLCIRGSRIPKSKNNIVQNPDINITEAISYI
ncbi:uncharacterized protein [Clytia hemisphaerica]|uniref:uncharacterized protein n=1 Tax=Clytia hemisphaerica TaxID=252671 RepID=UPI0034D67902